MVSLRRRRLLGLFSDNVVIPMPTYFDDEGVAHFDTPPPNRINARPTIPLTDTRQTKEIDKASTGPDSLALGGTNSNKHQTSQANGQRAKHKNQDRKKNADEEEICSLRGVYCKNMKWQAAIKVNKKQVHLGTLETQEEAARVYDRAAFMQGRAPNFELLEEDKEELRQLRWEEFLKKTKLEISCKRKRKRRDEPGSEDFQNEAGEGPSGGSSSEVAELE